MSRRVKFLVPAVATGIVCICFALNAQPPAPKMGAEVASVREQAALMHKMYAATLTTMHHHFFRRERSVLPARALEDVFATMERQTKSKARWISVNAKAMSVNHEPKSDFDKKAAAAIAAGRDAYEHIEDDYYHRAGVIPLGSDCVSCHTGMSISGKSSPGPFFAGLIISIPLGKE